MKQVGVLLSTYNGAAHLGELLQSIKCQVEVEPRLVVRDDGSTDRTRELVAQFAGPMVDRIVAGEHIGVPASYFELLKATAGDYDYVAFCDQDDVWLPRKLAAALARLETCQERPTLYCGGLLITNSDLEIIGRTNNPRRAPSFGNALVENIALGPTIVLNSSAHRLIAEHLPHFAVMHDAWCYLVCSAWGTVILDDNDYVLYRQHAQNHVGLDRNYAVRLKRLATVRAGSYLREQRAQAREFIQCFDTAHLNPEDQRLLLRFAASHQHLFERAAWFVNRRVFRQRRLDDLALRIMLALR